MFEDSERKEIADLGEFGLIAHLTKGLEMQRPTTITGVGDDSAVIAGGDMLKVVSTDMLLEGVHFDLTFHPLKHLGYKAVAVNVSDIVAMNAKPTQLLVSIAFSNRFSLQAVEELYEGIRLACKHYEVDLVGGDTNTSRQGLCLSITAIGEVSENRLVRRTGAKPGQLICVSGDLGAAYMGLQLLEREKRVFLENPDMQPDLEGHDYILQRQLKPEARLDIIRRLETADIIPSAMIDISDGLASELFHICQASNTGCTIYETRLPIDPATVSICEAFNMSDTTAALSGGEDYELLFTVPLSDYEKVKMLEDVSIIGEVKEAGEGLHLITKNDQQFKLKAQGWKHV